MKKILGAAAVMLALNTSSFGQEKEVGREKIFVPAVVKQANLDRYPQSKNHKVGRAADADGKISYEVEIHGKDVIFDRNGNFVKEEK